MGNILQERPDTPVAGFNGTGVDLPAKRLVTGQEDSIALPSAVTNAVYGLTRSTIKASSYGGVLLRGKGVLTAGTGGVTKGDRIAPEANTGKGITWAPATGVNASVAGVACSTAAADADFEIELLGPGAIAQGA